MEFLILGLILFCGIHLFPTLTRQRQVLVTKLGDNFYKGLFSIISLAGIVLMVIGYKSVESSLLYVPPVWGRKITIVLMLVSLVLFAAANMPGNVKRFTRHPMLWGLVTWAVAHLLANGDLAGVVFFASLGIFGLLAMLSANLRGAVKQSKKLPLTKDLLIIVAGTVVYVIIILLHPYLFGVDIF